MQGTLPNRPWDLQDDELRPPTTSSSPRLIKRSPSQTTHTFFIPQDRSLPSTDVNRDNIPDAYVAFILYCNPSFSLTTVTTTLRANFQRPPRNEKKQFETFRLFQLVQRYKAGNIKTWTQLAVDLGVDPPDTSKGQSTQKVQQYTVRLKRWMRSMHIDAFFDYLMDKPHPYYTKIPNPNPSDPYPAAGRDRVPTEDDMAIKSLDPSIRPKRGRRGISEAEADWQTDSRTPATAVMSPLPSAVPPSSAHPDTAGDPWAISSAATASNFVPWARGSPAPASAAPSAIPAHVRGQMRDAPPSAITPHPLSARTPSMAHPGETAFDNETTSGKRRKYGPNISSSLTSATPTGSKVRGRPAARRRSQDGCFLTFPASASMEKSAKDTMSEGRAAHDLPTPHAQTPTPLFERPSDGSGRPGRLSLQVPPHIGGPVRLATPPTAETNGHADMKGGHTTKMSTRETDPQHGCSDDEHSSFELVLTYDTLKRALSSDLLRGKLTGRRGRLSGDEAKRLSDAILQRLGVQQSEPGDRHENTCRLSAAAWLGLGDHLDAPIGSSTGPGKSLSVTRFHVDRDGYEEVVTTHDDLTPWTRDVFDLSWRAGMGGCVGRFDLTGLTLYRAPDLHPASRPEVIMHAVGEVAARFGMDTAAVREQAGEAERRVRGEEAVSQRGIVDDGNWKEKYTAMVFGANLARGELEREKQRWLDKLLDVFA